MPRCPRSGSSGFRRTPPGDPWAFSYTAVDRASGATVGSCAFKGPPDADGTVEVAYGTDEAHRGKGYATEMAAGLARFALASGRVRVVIAQTKADTGESARVLTKCGFSLIGEVTDPEDGLVHRWELRAGV